MNRPHPFDALSIAHLRLFDGIMRRRSFSAAARDLGISQPAASRAVASMEETLGGTLFLRTTRTVRPTSFAEEVFARLGPMFRELDQLEIVAQSRTSELGGTLRVAAPGAFGRRFVVPVVERFLSANPRVSVELMLTDRRTDLVAQGVDVAVRLGSLTQRTARTRIVGQTRGVLVGAKSLTDGKVIETVVDALALPVIMPLEPSDAVRKVLASHAKGIKPRVRMLVDDLEVMRSAVLEGLGLSVLPRWLVSDDLSTGRLVHLVPTLDPGPVPVRLVFPAGRVSRPLTRAFADALAKALRA